VFKRLSLSNEHILILASDDRGRYADESSVLDVRRRLAAAEAGAQAADDVQAKHADESVAELFAHRAVQDEIDSVVDERQDVEQVAESHVDLIDEARQQTTQKVDDALWKFSDEEQDDDKQ